MRDVKIVADSLRLNRVYWSLYCCTTCFVPSHVSGSLGVRYSRFYNVYVETCLPHLQQLLRNGIKSVSNSVFLVTCQELEFLHDLFEM